jgi:xylulose-5-phosphate/fructose-6-phosphate phosphoketolase
MVVLNDLDRFHLIQDVINRMPNTGDHGIELIKWTKVMLSEHKKYIQQYGQDIPEIQNWKWEPFR